MISVEKPGSPSEILEHHGTKGMKWGVRSQSKSSPSFKQKFPSGTARSQEIKRARVQTIADQTKVALQKDPTKRQQMHQVYLKNPDRATALRITRGEKTVLGLMAVGIPGVGTSAAAGYSLGMVSRRKLVERSQRRMN